MKEKTQHIRYFLFSQYLNDGMRITIEIVLPALICYQLGRLDIGLLLSTGAFCTSISDAPGPLEHKRNGMLYSIGFVFLMSVLTGFVNHNIILLAFLIVISTFFFTMLGVFGTRASSVGIAALLIMILRMDKVLPAREVLIESTLILAGGLWYRLISVLFFLFRPLRQAQRALGNCIHEMSKLLFIKAALYDPGSQLEEEYQRLLAQQVVVSEKLDEVRELLFKGKEIVKDSTRAGQAMLVTFTSVVDLYEQVTATWYDYSMLRTRFAGTGVLPEISALLKEIAEELDRTGLGIQSNIPYQLQFELPAALTKLKEKIDALKIENTQNLVLKKILVNLRHLGERFTAISKYFDPADDMKKRGTNKRDYSKFVSHQEINFAVFRDNLNLGSSIFRHALRMSITCILGFLIVKLISYGHHGYWILLTIVFILKPGYSISKERNFQRIAGTFAGGLIGVAFLLTIKDARVLLALMVLLMIGTYTYQRVNYTIMVIFLTPYILILSRFLGYEFMSVIGERILDTTIASVLAFIASYFLFPHWESRQLEAYMVSVLKANIDYLGKLRDYFAGNKFSELDYKLVRKEIYVSAANLSAAFIRMLSEPKSKQQNARSTNEFVVLNNVLSSNIAGLFTINTDKQPDTVSREILQPLNRSVSLLADSLQLMDGSTTPRVADFNYGRPLPEKKTTDRQLNEHIDFIYKLAVDIKKVVQKIKTSPV